MKLSEYAKLNSISYLTAYKHFKKGFIKGKQLATGTIVIDNIFSENIDNEDIIVATYARVSTSENKNNMETQSERLVSFANAKGYKVKKIVKEIASGLNDNRPKLIDLLNDNTIKYIIVEHSDRFSRFGFNFVKTLLNKSNRDIIVINPPVNDKEDLIEDFVNIITCFCAKIYGKRKNKRNTEKLIKELEN